MDTKPKYLIYFVIIALLSALLYTQIPFKKTYHEVEGILMEGGGAGFNEEPITVVVYENWVEIHYKNGKVGIVPRDRIKMLRTKGSEVKEKDN